MKRINTLILALITATITMAQAPQQMSYQAVIRNTSNNLVANTTVGMQLSILQGSATGTAVYVETQTPTTNANGVVTLAIGAGTVVSGTFNAINWANGPYFLKTETDPNGGTSYSITGTSQLLSVPYALYANFSGVPPSVNTQAATNITSNSATLNGSIKANGFITNVLYEYGLTPSYGSIAGGTPSSVSGNSTTPTSCVINNLLGNTTYHYTIKGTNAIDATYGSDLTFTTLPSIPLINYIYMDTTNTSTVQFEGSVNPSNSSTIVTFEYGTTTSYGTSVAASPSPISGSSYIQVLSANIAGFGLISHTFYHLRIKAINVAGTTYSYDYQFYQP